MINEMTILAGAMVAKPFAETAATLLGRLAGEPCKVVGDVTADWLRYWQWQQRISILNRAHTVIAREKIAVKAIPPGFLLPLLEEAGNVADDDLQTLWANLLASAIENEASCEPSYIQVLRSLSKRDAQLLLRISRARIKAKSVDAPTLEQCECCPLSDEEINALGFSNSWEFWESIDRLRDLLTMKPSAEEWIILPCEVRDSEGFLVTKVQAIVIDISLSYFGAKFVERVTRNKVASENIAGPGEMMSQVLGLGAKVRSATQYLENDARRRMARGMQETN